MNLVLIEILVVLGLIVAHGAFAMSEMARRRKLGNVVTRATAQRSR